MRQEARGGSRRFFDNVSPHERVGSAGCAGQSKCEAGRHSGASRAYECARSLQGLWCPVPHYNPTGM